MAKTILYMAKTVKLCLATNEVKDFMAIIDDRKENRDPITRRMNSCWVKEKPVLRRS